MWSMVSAWRGGGDFSRVRRTTWGEENVAYYFISLHLSVPLFPSSILTFYHPFLHLCLCSSFPLPVSTPPSHLPFICHLLDFIPLALFTLSSPSVSLPGEKNSLFIHPSSMSGWRVSLHIQGQIPEEMDRKSEGKKYKCKEGLRNESLRRFGNKQTRRYNDAQN